MRLIQAAVVSLALAAPLSAQSLRGVDLGEPIPDGLPEPRATQTIPPVAYTVWDFDDGLAMSATADAATGDVLYLELWRDPPEGSVASPIPGLTYGTSTRADIEALFGSEGIVFENRGRVAALPEIGLAIYYLAYEIEDSDTVISFVAIQPLTDASDDTADDAVLDSVIIADGAYLDQIWGQNRGRLPGYAPVPDPFITAP